MAPEETIEMKLQVPNHSCGPISLSTWGKSLIPGHWHICSEIPKEVLAAFQLKFFTSLQPVEAFVSSCKPAQLTLDFLDMKESDLQLTCTRSAWQGQAGQPQTHKLLGQGPDKSLQAWCGATSQRKCIAFWNAKWQQDEEGLFFRLSFGATCANYI